ncbi:MAG: hypothetical protein H7232_01475 [Aeromicrobium sp.]|nr:hypothetical protein [Burkholderiales bacterium]
MNYGYGQIDGVETVIVWTVAFPAPTLTVNVTLVGGGGVVPTVPGPRTSRMVPVLSVCVTVALRAGNTTGGPALPDANEVLIAVVIFGAVAPKFEIFASTSVVPLHSNAIGVADGAGVNSMTGAVLADEQSMGELTEIVCGVALPAPTMMEIGLDPTLPAARVIVIVPLLTVALKAGTPEVVVYEPATVVVMVGTVVPGLVTVTNTCVDCPHCRETALGETVIDGGGVGKSAVPGVLVRVG